MAVSAPQAQRSKHAKCSCVFRPMHDTSAKNGFFPLLRPECDHFLSPGEAWSVQTVVRQGQRWVGACFSRGLTWGPAGSLVLGRLSWQSEPETPAGPPGRPGPAGWEAGVALPVLVLSTYTDLVPGFGGQGAQWLRIYC